MGTSQSSNGSPPGVPMVPPWVPDLPLPGPVLGSADAGEGGPPDGTPEQGAPLTPAPGTEARLGLGRLPAGLALGRGGGRRPRRAVLHVHRGRGLLRVDSRQGTRGPLQPGGRDHPPAGPFGRDRIDGHARRLRAQPPGVLPQAPAALGSAADARPPAAPALTPRDGSGLVPDASLATLVGRAMI